MANKRQRLAHKKFKEEHPERFPKAEPTPPKDPSKKKKKKNSRLKPNKHSKPSFKKHPLRVPGMRPGESCFICKAQEHIAKNCPEKALWEKNKICLLCRRRGHSLKNCPNKTDETNETKFCYNCGDSGHALSKCPQPLQEGGTKFASCFICNERGHLSKNCPKNAHGIYPKGGSCKVCGGVTHLARDCPNKGSKGHVPVNGVENRWTGKAKVTKFSSGDDLEDDFVAEDAKQSKADPDGLGVDAENNGQTKSKKKQGPKVVNFLS